MGISTNERSIPHPSLVLALGRSQPLDWPGIRLTIDFAMVVAAKQYQIAVMVTLFFRQ
jgi:hypothetical protein